jgi:hypothetical protein
MTTEHQDPTVCCPEFDPAPWQDKLFTWENRKFIRDKVSTLFYMPVNFGKIMKRIDGKIRNAGAVMPDYMGLSDHTSQWNMDIYVAVDKEIPGADNVTLSGKFFSRVYEGPFGKTGKWMKDFKAVLTTNGLTCKKVYMWYTTCPKCAKKYGKNYVVILARVD